MLASGRRGTLVPVADESSVVHLDPVDRRHQRLVHGIAQHRATELVIRVGHPDETALGADGSDRVDCRQVPLDRPLDKGGDEVAGLGPHLLTDDDGQPCRRGVASSERTVDAVVIRDGKVGQPARHRRAHDFGRVREAIE